MMRPLVMDFRHDMKGYGIDDQFMFGPFILVNPIVTEGATSRRVYLPASDRAKSESRGDWFDFWSGRDLPAGDTIDVESPIDVMPIYVRAGSVLPLGPSEEYAAEKSGPIEIRVYRGADGDFTLYEDEGDGYGYEKGRYATIPIHWDEQAAALTIGDRRGDFPGLRHDATFHVVWVSPGHGVGIDPTDKVDAVVEYQGSAVTVSAQQE
jgi:alpha-D-xyloside xylohydrolase